MVSTHLSDGGSIKAMHAAISADSVDGGRGADDDVPLVAICVCDHGAELPLSMWFLVHDATGGTITFVEIDLVGNKLGVDGVASP